MKRECKYNRSDIIRYLQNKMSREEESNYQQHLTMCKECYEDTKRLRLLISNLGTQPHRIIKKWVYVATVAIMIAGGTSILLLREPKERGIKELELHYDRVPIYNDVDSIDKDSMKIDSIKNIVTNLKKNEL